MLIYSNDLFGQPRKFSHLFQIFNLNYVMVSEVFKAYIKKTKSGKETLNWIPDWALVAKDFHF